MLCMYDVRHTSMYVILRVISIKLDEWAFDMIHFLHQMARVPIAKT